MNTEIIARIRIGKGKKFITKNINKDANTVATSVKPTRIFDSIILTPFVFLVGKVYRKFCIIGRQNFSFFEMKREKWLEKRTPKGSI